MTTRAIAIAAAVLAAAGSSGAATGPPCGTYSGRGCAPPGARVDLRRPTFSRPTRITNRLFPIRRLRSALLLGHVGGKPFRTETTLLPGTQVVRWEGRRARVLVSQYVAYLDRRLEEVALDRYAQADDGSVWYFGEDVFDYEHGAVATTEGTWVAGREGPPAMIMPARPRLGDVFRTENAPPIVFEEVKVTSVGRTVPGPLGPVRGAIVGEELHADGTHEDKIFAPGYGEFRTAGGGDLEALALAVPADAHAGPVPAALRAISTNAVGLLDASRAEDWRTTNAILRHLHGAWRGVRPGAQPRLVVARMRVSLRALDRAAAARRPAQAGRAALDVVESALDLELRYRPPAEIDRERFVLSARRLLLDAAAGDRDGVAGDVATLEWIRDRIAATLDGAGRRELDARLRALRAASDAGNLRAAGDHAARLAARLRVLAP
jgi:hypothetical protein